MKLNTIQRPSRLQPAVCAPSASALPFAGIPVIAAPLPAQAPRVHQVQIQAELAEVLVVGGAYGFEGTNVLSAKRMTDDSGTPPRGRPV